MGGLYTEGPCYISISENSWKTIMADFTNKYLYIYRISWFYGRKICGTSQMKTTIKRCKKQSHYNRIYEARKKKTTGKAFTCSNFIYVTMQLLKLQMILKRLHTHVREIWRENIAWKYLFYRIYIKGCRGE